MLPTAISDKLSGLDKCARKWSELPDADRATVARKCRAQLATLDMDWVPQNLKCIGLDPSYRDAGNSLSFDPFLFLATVASRLDKIAASYEGSLPVKPGTSVSFDRQLPDQGPSIYKMGEVGRSAPGVHLELWADAKLTDPTNPTSWSSGKETDPTSASTPGVGVVLGAGNQNFLTVVDVLEVAFMHKKCVLLKHHPLRHFMAAPVAHILQPLAEAGAYDQCADSDLTGAHASLVSHPQVVHVHMTGSGATHDRVYAALKAAGREKKVLFTSELGCVTPWIVCPGRSNGGQWAQSSIEDHASMLAAGFKSSCSMNCLSPKVLVLPPESVWPQRAEFLKVLRGKLASMPQPPPYYPGAHKRFKGFEEQYPDAEHIDAPPAQEAANALKTAAYPELGQNISQLPSLLVDVGTLGSNDCRPYALKTEAFAPVLAIATVSCAKGEDFPLAAAKAVNEHVFGTLSCNVSYPDERDETLDKMVLSLNYGCVSVNCWAAHLYGQALGVWGGAPGSWTPSAPNSGLGFVGNAARIPCPRKSLGISPFVNKGIIMDKAMPYALADVLTIVISGKKNACFQILGVLLRRMCGCAKP